VPPPVTRQVVVTKSSCAEYQDELREDFRWQCAYCGIAETEAHGLAFNIEHHTPKAAGGGDAYSNLYWACWHCNRGKSAWMASDPYEALRVDLEDPEDHLQIATSCSRESNYCDGCPEPTNCVAGRTEKGRYNILLLDLNSPALQFVRRSRRAIAEVDEFIAHGLRQLGSVKLDAIANVPRRMQFQRILASLKGQAKALGVVSAGAMKGANWSIHINAAKGVDPGFRRSELAREYGARFMQRGSKGSSTAGSSGTTE